MADYDVSTALREVEDTLIDSMMRNMKRHVSTERQEGISYAQWQAEQLAALAEFRKSKKEYNQYFADFNSKLGEALQKAYETGGLEQEMKILAAIKKGWKRSGGSSALDGSFFKLNDRRLNAYIAAVKRDMAKAETALLRMTDDQYRKAIFNAGVAYNTGAVTLPQAIDTATRDFLTRGFNCVEYRDGRRVSVDTYAEMALRTSVTRAYLMGESAKRDEWGVNTVIVNRRGSACPKCMQYIGRVFYDDVYGSIKPHDSKYPLLSSAIAGGLYHPNCKDIHTTYFEGVSEKPKPLTADEERKAAQTYDLEQEQRHNERQIRRFKRLSKWTNDPQEKQKYSARLSAWEQRNKTLIDEHGDVLRRRREREISRFEFEMPDIKDYVGNGVDNSAESGIIEEDKLQSELGEFKNKLRSDTRVDEEYYQALKDKFSHGSDTAKAVFNKYVPTDSIADAEYIGTAHFDPADKKIYMDFSKDLTNDRGQCVTWFHEHGHLIDNAAGMISSNPDFRKALNDDYLSYMKAYGKKNGLKTFDKVQAAIGKEIQDMRKHSAVSDLLNGLSKGNIQGVAGHGFLYWTDDSVYCSEAFAHMFEAQFDSVRYKEMEKYFPNALKMFEEMLGGLA